ncbi:hypothetical protein PsYK624_165880 [Phanerochaete sordida]|uniref:DUF6532 domain-containing protein n=1 Tax=Phanerochaete sordida TaxID=48140 RepID=A0A9P3LM04_9APHY|nr:hypothetical protein PsYK624_165880 [Phanerochaete sordida]
MPPAKPTSQKSSTPPADETSNLPGRMKTRASNAGKHPGRVDLENSDNEVPLAKQGARRRGTSKSKATSAPGDVDSLMAGLTKEQVLTLYSALEAKMKQDGVPQHPVSTLSEHRHKSSGSQDPSQIEPSSAATQAEDAAREKTEELQDVDEDMEDEAHEGPAPLRRAHGQVGVTDESGNLRFFTPREFGNFEPFGDEIPSDDDAQAVGHIPSRQHAQTNMTKRDGKRRASEDHADDDMAAEDNSDVMVDGFTSDITTPVRPVAKRARTNVPSRLALDWQKQVASPSMSPSLHSKQMHESALPRLSQAAATPKRYTAPVVNRPTTSTRMNQWPSKANHPRRKQRTLDRGVRKKYGFARTISHCKHILIADLQTQVGIELKTEPEPKHSGEDTSVGGTKGRKRATRTSQVPIPTDQDDTEAIWTSVIVPRFLAYVGSLKNPWDANSLKEEDAVLQTLWHDAYGEVLDDKDKLRKAREVVAQRAFDWRSKIGKAAIKAVGNYLDSSDHRTEEQRKAYYTKYCSDKNPRCLYFDEEARRGAYRADVVLQAFAAHLSLVSGREFEFGPPAGALALCAAAVERAFLMWKSGRKLSEDDRAALIKKSQANRSQAGRNITAALQVEAKKVKTFSESMWGSVTAQHLPYTTTLSDSKWAQVIDGATSSPRGVLSGTGSEELNEIEREMVLSDDEELYDDIN